MNDIEEIRRLVVRCGRAGDENDVEAYLACFTVDGTFARSDSDAVQRGHAALRGMVETYPVHGRHVTSDHLVDVEGDRAHLTSYLSFHDAAAGFALRMFGIYHDDLVRSEGTWLFEHRLLEVLFEAD